jgi:hypothetical protein
MHKQSQKPYCTNLSNIKFQMSRKRFIATMKKDQQKSLSYLIVERHMSGLLSDALMLRLHSTSLMILSLLRGWSHCS